MNNSIWDIDGNKILSTNKKAKNCYDNKPIRLFKHDDFASFILDNQEVSTLEILPNYFTPFLKEYLEVIPRLAGKCERVYLYGVFEVIKSSIKR